MSAARARQAGECAHSALTAGQALRVRRDGATLYVMPWRSEDGLRVAYTQQADYHTERVTLTDRALRAELGAGRVKSVPIWMTPGWCDRDKVEGQRRSAAFRAEGDEREPGDGGERAAGGAHTVAGP